MAAHTRWTRLLEILSDQGHLDVLDAAEQLGCSAATVRRDLDELARQNLLTRTRGGAVVSAVAYDLPLRYKAARRADEKQRIAKAAAELVPTGSTVGLNGGTTTSEVARELALRPEPPGGGTALTVVTNAINIANELAVRPQVKIVVTGGVARPNSYELVGPLVDSVLRTFALDYTILGVDAVHPRFGAATHDESEAGQPCPRRVRGHGHRRRRLLQARPPRLRPGLRDRRGVRPGDGQGRARGRRRAVHRPGDRRPAGVTRRLVSGSPPGGPASRC